MKPDMEVREDAQRDVRVVDLEGEDGVVVFLRGSQIREETLLLGK